MNLARKTLTPEDLRFVPPELPQDAILRVLEDQYGLTGTLEPLAGERDQSHKFSTRNGAHYVAKVSSLHEDAAVIDFQISALLHLEHKDPELLAPRLLRTRDGHVAASISDHAG